MWNHTSSQLPEEGRVVLTISESGMEQALKRQGNLWYLPDGSMYVYYTPIKWRYLKWLKR